MSFRQVENPEFKTFCHMLRSGYSPPSRQKLSNELLTQVYDKEIQKSRQIFEFEIVTLAIDGWSNINNFPIICGSITKHDGAVALAKTVDTSGEKHDSMYLKRLTFEITLEAQNVFGCKVGILVTDSARNMSRMRSEISDDNNINILTIPCAAHIANLLAHDVSKIITGDNSTQQRILHVIKYFRNHHLPKSWLKEAGGTFQSWKCQ